jgi:hypothetical protein
MAKLDGTNGLIQQYDYQVLTTGFSYTFASGTQTLVANPAGTLATGTITMPAAPADGMVITIESTQAITALTVQGNTGQSLVGAPVRLYPNQPQSFVYRISNTTWYPYAVARSAVLQVVTATATSNNSTTSASYVTTNHSVTITPSSSTSKIWINLSAVGGSITGTNTAVYTIYRGGSNIAPSASAFVLMSPNNSPTIYFPFAINYLDSPATTSATTYTVYMLSQNGSGTVQYGSNPNSITPSNVLTVMEIAA